MNAIQCNDDYNPRQHTSTTQGYKSWSHGMTNVSIPEVNMLKNSSTLTVSAPIHLSIKLAFISVNSSGETYFVDALRSWGETPEKLNQEIDPTGD